MSAPFFKITNDDLTALKDKVLVITGGSSGIGLAAAKISLSLGSKVVVGDWNECPIQDPSLTFVRTDVREWDHQLRLFDKAIEVHGRVDHVFANAGIGPVDTFCKMELGPDGKLLPPDMKCMRIDLDGPIYTSKIGLYHLRSNPSGGSIVITASASSFSPFVATDYGTAKHGTLGLMRNLAANLVNEPIRVNCITPLWTASGLVPAEQMEREMGIISQPPEDAARSALILMADEKRRGQTMFSKRGMAKEVDGILMQAIIGAMEPGEGDGPRTEEQQKAFAGTFAEQQRQAVEAGVKASMKT